MLSLTLKGPYDMASTFTSTLASVFSLVLWVLQSSGPVLTLFLTFVSLS